MLRREYCRLSNHRGRLCRLYIATEASLATIGRKTAVAEFGRLRLAGATAWWLWGALHLAFLVGGRNRLTVMLGWLWSYFTYGVGVQLITGETWDRASDNAP